MDEKKGPKKTIKIENVRLSKSGKKILLIIPQAFIRHGLLDPDQIYDVEFDIHQQKKDE